MSEFPKATHRITPEHAKELICLVRTGSNRLLHAGKVYSVFSVIVIAIWRDGNPRLVKYLTKDRQVMDVIHHLKQQTS